MSTPTPTDPPPPPDDRLETIFNAALNHPPAEREAYLGEACAGDADRLREIRALLKAHEDAGDFLQTAATPPELQAERARLKPEQAGERIGNYKLLEQIGEGGFGVVWVAEQEQPVKRRVALKIIKLGMDTKAVIARFEQERQALAMMDHPNIAKVFDAGVTTTGRPFFVMELVRGIKITDYCDQASLPTADRLQLFIAVCHAVQHAHQKGIIHRDIKPPNILVTLHDGVPVPKVIDFGVAKATQQRLTDLTVYTQFEQMIGTPLYMSPEQAEMSGLDIDTRSDIYSLGVLLYELLAGRTPFDPKELLKRGLDEIRRTIREQEPPKPSTALSTMAIDARKTIAQHRQSDEAKLPSLLRGDLDWIVMKALEKDRTRRYDTANAFAEDIQRHLVSEPVVASPPSNLYRFRKLVRRNRLAFAASAAVAVALLAGIAGSAWQAVRANHEAQRALAAERIATERAEEVKREAATSKAVIDFLQNEFLAKANPQNEPDRDVKLRTIIDRAAKKLEGRFAGQPLVDAAIRDTIGENYDDLDEYSAAQPHLEAALKLRRAALGDENPDTLISMRHLGSLYMRLQRFAEAESLLTRALETSRRVLGAEQPETLHAMVALGSFYHNRYRLTEAESLFTQALEISRRVLGAEHRSTLEVMLDLSNVFKDSSRYTEAEALATQVLDISRRTPGSEESNTFHAMETLALVYFAQARYAKAEPLLIEDLRVRTPGYPNTLEKEGLLGLLYVRQARYTEAKALLESLPDKYRRLLGANDARTALSMALPAMLYEAEGRYAEAERLFTQGLEILRKSGERNPATLYMMYYLGNDYVAQGRYAEAEPLLVTTLEAARKILGEHLDGTLTGRLALARLYDLAGRPAKAESLLRENLRLLRQQNEVPLLLGFTLAQLAETLLAENKPSEAEPLAREAVIVREKEIPDEWSAYQARSLLGASLLAQKKYAEAEPLLVAGAEGLEQREAKIPAPDKSRLTEAITSLLQLYNETNRPEKAAAWRAKIDTPKAAPAKP